MKVKKKWKRKKRRGRTEAVKLFIFLYYHVCVSVGVTINRPDDTIKLAGCEIGTSSQVTFDLYAQVWD